MTFRPPTLKVTAEGFEIELPHLGCSLLLRPITKCPTLPPAAVIDTDGIELTNVISLADRRCA